MGRWDKYEFEQLMSCLIEDPSLYKQSQFVGVQLNPKTVSLLKKGITSLSPIEKIDLNKNLIQSVFAKAIKPVSEWGNGVSLWMLQQLKSIGLRRAWLGLDDRSLGILHQNVIQQAVKNGYLIAPYDSYNSIQLATELKMPTALFQHNPVLYQNDTIINQNGKPLYGFLNIGRTLNSSFAMPEVKYRLQETLSNYQVPFNSWFFDTDGAGELYNDFSKAHRMTQAQDAINRLQRMRYAAEHRHLVIGTEDGDDYSAGVVAFGHGDVTAGIWDADMRRHKNSPYYMGKYFAPLGIPPRYAKLTPLKPTIATIYFSPKYSIPLYQLVYHNSVIVSDHWEYATFKFPQEITNNVLRTFLYDYPPLLHLDRDYWKKHKDFFKSYFPIWQSFSLKVAGAEMSDFHLLGREGLIQATRFSNGIRVIANFSDRPYKYQQWHLSGKSVIAINHNKQIVQFSPGKF
ncbi:glycoside hydrolase [Coxiella burnetii]|uniref:glycoside hydrolase n=1 Tax=Coxiella burnetii TaxID=777 RepID=UPI000163263A|nr:glycoside hydrolase [Coxiella burnetii]